ncbi:MAG: hypothetical protein ACI9Z3_000734 [Roseivirga sp.]|jgi:hypothetical protein
MKKVSLSSSVVLLLLMAIWSCQENYEEPEVSLESYQIEQGFEQTVVEKKKDIKEGSKVVWDYAKSLVDESLSKGTISRSKE